MHAPLSMAGCRRLCVRNPRESRVVCCVVCMSCALLSRTLCWCTVISTCMFAAFKHGRQWHGVGRGRRPECPVSARSDRTTTRALGISNNCILYRFSPTRDRRPRSPPTAIVISNPVSACTCTQQHDNSSRLYPQTARHDGPEGLELNVLLITMLIIDR